MKKNVKDKSHSSEFNELAEQSEDYQFDEKLLGAIPVLGVLKKSDDPKNCILVVSNNTSGDLIIEIRKNDIVKHEIDHTDNQKVQLHIKPNAIVKTSFIGKVENSTIASALVDPAYGGSTREPIPQLPWKDIVAPFSKIDRLLNMIDRLSWHECRLNVVRQCERRFPPGPLRNQCITNGYIQCGEPPRLEVSERQLEQLADLFRELIPIEPKSI